MSSAKMATILFGLKVLIGESRMTSIVLLRSSAYTILHPGSPWYITLCRLGNVTALFRKTNKFKSTIDIMSMSYDTALMWIPQDLIND